MKILSSIRTGLTKSSLILATLAFANVLLANVVLTVNPGVTLNGTESTFIATTVLTTFTDPENPPGDLVASINWGDTTTSAGLITFVSGNTFSVSGNHTYAEEGDYTYTVNVADILNSLSGSNTGAATISDAPLTPGAPFSGFGTAMGTTGFVATFNDGDPTGPVSDFTATINWGDGAPTSMAMISQPGGVGTPFDVSGTHIYNLLGAYTVSVTVDDVGGSSTTLTGTEQITPEPGTFVFLGTGLLFGYAALRFRRKSQSL